MHVLGCSKKVLQTETYLKKVLKLGHFFFRDPRPNSQILTQRIFDTFDHHPFENFLLDTLNSEQKPSVKYWSIGSVRNRLTGRSTGDDFEIYRSGRSRKS